MTFSGQITTIIFSIKDTNPAKIKNGSKWCFGNVNIETPIYENIKFSAKKFSSSNICLVRVLESSERLL